jgi:hypothetical protein
MHKYLTEVFATLDASRRELRAAVDAVPAGRRQERPKQDSWSTAEVVEHVFLVERRFAGVVADAIAKAREAGLGAEGATRPPFPEAVTGRMRDRSQPREAPEAVHPGGSMTATEAWTSLEGAGHGLREALSAADGLALSQVLSEHRLWGPLDAYQWVELAASHELRHAAQIRDIAAQFQRT